MSLPETHSLPWKELLVPQIVNFTLFVGILIYLIRKPLKQHFSGKSEDFEAQKKKAEDYRIHAEKQNFEVRNQMKLLEETASSSLETAKKDSVEMKEKLLADAKEAARKINEDTNKMAEFELARAIATLKEELVIKATQLSEQNLENEMNDSVQSQLNDDFIGKIQVRN
ncbi:MAG: ATP synthase F0 subunit B [Bdellovibrionales bacterium]|nr:ATP synthase F0 subunit B [Bdellovibrionales bacterium]